MQHVTLGSSGLPVSRLGLGCWAFGGHGWGPIDDNDSIAAIRRALDCGVTFFDSADVYGFGHSERLLAQALGARRRDVVIATKFGVRWDADGQTRKDVSPAYLRVALEESLRRLQLDCIPLYYAHWPDECTPVEETMAELDRCRREGKVRAIGLSNYSAAQLRRALTVAPVDAVQVQFSLLERDAVAELSPVLSEHSATLVTWGSLARGLLTGKYHAGSTFGPDDSRSRDRHFQGPAWQHNLRVVEALKPVAGRVRVPLPQLALRWVLDTPGVGVALFGARTPDQVDINTGVMDWRLSEQDYEAVNGILGGDGFGGSLQSPLGAAACQGLPN